MKKVACLMGPIISTDPAGTASAVTPPWKETEVVGKPLPRIDGAERVTGKAVYTRDLAFPGMLHAAIVRCPHAHARIKRIDTTTAAKMPGVRGILDGESPGAKIPWYAGEKGNLSWLFDPECRYEGEEVVALAAETPEQAFDAARAVVVEYDILPFVITPQDALKSGAPALYSTGNRPGRPQIQQRGNVDKGFASADVVLEQKYSTSTQIHTPLEVHCSVASWEGEELTVWDSAQGVFDIQQALASCLQLPLASVRVISHYMGGGFGAKLDLSKHTVMAALLSRQTSRPVKIVLSREDTFRCVGNRPPNWLTLKAGARKDGTLSALSIHILSTVGAYPGGGSSSYLVSDLYRCPNVRTEEEEAFTNAGKDRAFRAPGFPQCAWALEQMMDSLAEKIGMDPVEFRLKNIPEVSQANENTPFTSTGLARCLSEGAEAFGWKSARARPKPDGPIRRGVGVAAAMWGYPGEPNATAILKLYPDGSLNLNIGCSDIGTGTKTIMAMVVSEELSVPLDRIKLEHADSGSTQYSPGSGGSQTVVANAPAVRAAALALKSELLTLAAGELKQPREKIALRGGALEVEGQRIPFDKLKFWGERHELMSVGRREPHPKNKLALPFAAHFAEVEVNMLTGEVRVVRMLAAQDSGRVGNRLTFNNQVFGGITMGIGLGVTERRVLDPQTGKMVNADWHNYKLPTAMDVPKELTCLPIDPHDAECNSAGVKGLGEPATIPTAAAIANAVYHAIGVRIVDAPMTPKQVLQQLSSQLGRK
jgi:CO/xanthine dehydrogenase Mo-binding subunit